MTRAVVSREAYGVRGACSRCRMYGGGSKAGASSTHSIRFARFGSGYAGLGTDAPYHDTHSSPPENIEELKKLHVHNESELVLPQPVEVRTIGRSLRVDEHPAPRRVRIQD